MRILAVDPGEKNIGLALSDPTSTLAVPLAVFTHISRLRDAERIVQLAVQKDAGLIVIGKSFDEEGNPTSQSKLADRLAEAIRQLSQLPIEYWDESFSTQEARQALIDMGVSRRKRSGHMDDRAAATLLQSYLDAKAGS